MLPDLQKLLERRPNSTTLLIGQDHGDLVAELRAGASFMLRDERPYRLTHPDYIELDAQGPGQTEQVKKWMEAADKRPFEGKWIVMSLAGVDRLDPAAANAILKTAEEPPDHVCMLLSATNPSAILPTIRSRAFVFIVPKKPRKSLPYDQSVVDEALKLLTALKLREPKAVIQLGLSGDFKLILEVALLFSTSSKVTAALLEHMNYLASHVNPEAVLLSLHRKCRSAS